MRLRILTATLLPTVCQPAAEPTTLGLIIGHSVLVSASLRRSFEVETEQAIDQSIKGANLKVAWRDEGTSSAFEPLDRLIVVSFQGDCTTTVAKSPPSDGALGWTSTVDGQVLPFIGIDCSRIKELLAETAAWPRSEIPTKILVRTMSRVAMHEIYPVLSARKHPDDDGLFKAAYSSANLLAPFPYLQRVNNAIADVAVKR